MTIDTSRQSPNKDSRQGQAIDMIVLHATVGSFQSSLTWLTNPASRVSSHYLVRKDGFIAQLVPDSDEAWHAGKALWNGHTNINQRSIGIELENLEGMELGDGTKHGPDPYPQAQIDAARALCWQLIAQYHIARGMFVRHLDVATPAGRKTDPAHFPWDAFVNSLYVSPASLTITPDTTLIAAPRATEQQCARYLTRRSTGAYSRLDVASIVRSYFVFAAGLDPLLAIAQLAHETSSLTSYWSQPPHRNPAGIGVTGVPGAGLSFNTWEDAARAHLGRLLAYALPARSGTAAQQQLIDAALALRPLPAVYRGAAQALRGLNGRWATGQGYAQAVADIANQIVRM